MIVCGIKHTSRLKLLQKDICDTASNRRDRHNYIVVREVNLSCVAHLSQEFVGGEVDPHVQREYQKAKEKLKHIENFEVCVTDKVNKFLFLVIIVIVDF